MAITHGMNPDEVEKLGNQLQTEATNIETAVKNLNTLINSTTWEGPDATTFKTNWWPQHQSHLQKVAEDLRGFGQSALNNASEQRNVSGH